MCDQWYQVKPDDPHEIAMQKLDLQREKLKIDKEFLDDLAMLFCIFLAFVGLFLFAVPTSALIDAQPLSGICSTVAGLIGAVSGFLIGKRLMQ